MNGADFVVVGAGAAGMSAAIALARSGARVALLERNESIGGIVVHGLIHTIGGLYDSGGKLLNGGLPQELAERLADADPQTAQRKIGKVWVLNVCPAVYARTLETWLGEESRLELFLGVRELRVTAVDGRISAVDFAVRGEPISAAPSALIDCTGEANVIAMIDPELVSRDTESALAGLIFRMRGVHVEELAFPGSIAIHRAILSAVNEGTLPPECSHVWIDTGVHRDEVFVKMSVEVESDADPQLTPRLERARSALIDFLVGCSAFARARVTEMGRLSFRGGARVKGEYRLTADDVRQLRRFSDTACRCAWPIEYWSPARGVMLEYLRDGGHYEIPLGSLKVKGLENAWGAGKCLSADHLAQASARVSGCCWAMGQAAGLAAGR